MTAVGAPTSLFEAGQVSAVKPNVQVTVASAAMKYAPAICQFSVPGYWSSLPYLSARASRKGGAIECARPISVAARQGWARRMGTSRQGRSGWCRTFAGRPSLGRRLDGHDTRCLLDPGLPEGDGRGRRDAGSDRRCDLLRQPYRRRQRRLRIAVGRLGLTSTRLMIRSRGSPWSTRSGSSSRWGCAT